MTYPLFLLILGVSGVYTDSHSLLYYCTLVTGEGWGLPQFFIVAYVDDQQIGNYNSDSREAVPLASWINKLGSEYFDEQTTKAKLMQFFFNNTVRTAMNHYNWTGGSHCLQTIQGCEWTNNGSNTGLYQIGYNGTDAIYLDTNKWVYHPTIPEAQYIAQMWNSPDVLYGAIIKYYLEKICIEDLKKYIEYGRDDLEKKVPPEVKVTGQKSVQVTKLHCWVYGFYPRDIDVKWMKYETDEVPLDEAKPIVPNPDITYQTRVTVEVPAGEEDSYSCHVDHSSLKKTLIVKWNPKSGSTTGVIIAVVFGCLIVLLLVGVKYMKPQTPPLTPPTAK